MHLVNNLLSLSETKFRSKSETLLREPMNLADRFTYYHMKHIQEFNCFRGKVLLLNVQVACYRLGNNLFGLELYCPTLVLDSRE